MKTLENNYSNNTTIPSAVSRATYPAHHVGSPCGCVGGKSAGESVLLLENRMAAGRRGVTSERWAEEERWKVGDGMLRSGLRTWGGICVSPCIWRTRRWGETREDTWVSFWVTSTGNTKANRPEHDDWPVEGFPKTQEDGPVQVAPVAAQLQDCDVPLLHIKVCLCLIILQMKGSDWMGETHKHTSVCLFIFSWALLAQNTSR